ncbi:hypothetical protein KAU09_04175 [Candidatus Parcubacteria bacterium]|nr:hypothetical protein [Candidatus Parcubacteria bacterium]
MYFPDDFKRRLKAVFPVEYHGYVDDGVFSVTEGQLGKGSNFSINAETIVKARKDGREEEDIFNPAQNAVKMRKLNKELGQLYKKQFGISD